MQIVFDLVGKCQPYGKPCVHFDGEYRSDSACGGCERNPKISQLRDGYKTAKQMAKDIEGTPLPDVPDEPGIPPDRLSQLEADNKRELGEWGVTPKVRLPHKGKAPARSKRPKQGD